MSPTISTPAALAFSTVQCGSGWVSGTPGESIRAANCDQSAVAQVDEREALGLGRVARRPAFSSQSATSAPPATQGARGGQARAGQAEHGDRLALEAADRDHGVRLPSPTAASGWPGRAGPA